MKKDFTSLRTVYTALYLLLLIVLSRPAFAVYETNTTELNNEFWISTSTDSSNLGTLDNPFICATESEFDTTMNNLPANSTVHILAGTYQTRGDGSGGFALKSGQKILGSGMDITVIQLVTNAPSGVSVMGSVGRALGIEVSDLTLDCHYIAGVSGNVHYGGLDLNGSRLIARRVKVVNFASYNDEAFGIGFNANYSGPFNSDGNIIEGCEVTNYFAESASATCTAIALDGQGGCISGIIRDNHVFLQVTNSPRVAFNGSDMHDVLIEGNYVDGATAGFYGDSGGYTNVIVAHNTFKNCVFGAQLSNVPRQNLTFCYNTIILPTSGGIAFYFDPDISYTNIVIAGNDIRFQGQAAAGSLFLDANNIKGLIVNNNTVDPVLTNIISGCTGVSIYNNDDLNGNFLVLPNLNQVMPPNGITRTVVTNSSYNAKYTDEYIGVQTTNVMAGRTVNLPSAVGCAGKEIIIDDESGKASASFPISIVASTFPPCHVNGGSSVNLTTSYGAKTIVSDGANWFAH